MSAEALAVSAPTPATPLQGLSQLVAGAVGNVLEWYDFAVYGYFAAIFGKNFFPSSSPVISLVSAFGVFAAAFLMRPIGGALFGHIGDRFGRKRALMISVAMMTLATICIGFLPTYAAIGAAAPLLLVGLRLLQGISVGGEFCCSIIFLVEHSSPRRRGVVSSFASLGATGGILLGSGVGTLETWMLDQAQMEAWGWRVPFLLGSVLGGAAYMLRRVLRDDAQAPRHGEKRLPLAEALADDWRDILRGAIACASFAVSFYLIFVYLVTMMHQVDGLAPRRALEINTLSMLLVLAATPCFGLASDRLGRKPVLLGSVSGIIVLALPLFWLLLRPDFTAILIGQAVFALLIAAWGGPMEAMLVEMFRNRTRCTSLALSYNSAFALLGGTAPIVAVYLVSREHLDYGPAFYLMAIGLMSFIVVLTIPNRTGQPLR
jgi:MHS family proline/betaine transporter-like MFS transporter